MHLGIKMLSSYDLTLFATPYSVDLAFKIRDELNRLARVRQGALEQKLNTPRETLERQFLGLAWERYSLARDNLERLSKKYHDLEVYLDSLGDGPFYISPVEWRCFADGTMLPRIWESVRGSQAYVVARFDISHTMYPEEIRRLYEDPHFRKEFLSMFSPKEAAISRAISLIYALRQAKVGSITGVFPKLAGSRQERTKGREPNLSRKFLETMGPNLDSIITIDPHNEAVEGFSGVGLDAFNRVYASKVLVGEIKGQYDAIATPDAGGVARARHYSFIAAPTAAQCAQRTGLPLIIGIKEREWLVANKVKGVRLIGEVRGKRVCIVDDLGDTCGTLIEVAERLYEQGATAVGAAFTHPLLNGDAIPKLIALKKEHPDFRVITTDSVTHRHLPDWITVKSIAPLLAETIYDIHTHRSTNSLYDGLPHNPREE